MSSFQPSDSNQAAALRELRSSNVIAYTQAGYTLFACRSTGAKAKAPVHDDWQHTPYNADLTEADLPDFYGVKLNDDDLVLDFDPRRGETQLKDLWEALGLEHPINTFIVKTMNGGYHVYFKKPVGWRVRASVPGYPAIEIKTKGKLVIGAGSASGRYELVRGAHDQIADAEQLLLNFVVDNVAELRDQGVESDDEGTRVRFQLFCRETLPAVEGDGGDSRTYATAIMGREFGLPEQTVYDIMRLFYNPRCTPPWDEEDLRAKVRNAYAYAQNAAGTLNPTAEFLGIDLSDVLGQDETQYPPNAMEDAYQIRWKRKVIGGNLVPEPVFTNAVNYFMLKPNPARQVPLYRLIRFNMFSRQIEFTRRAPWHSADRTSMLWTDDDTIMLKWYFAQHEQIDFSTAVLNEAIMAVAQIYAVDPPSDWLASIQWDGTPRLHRWLHDYLGTPNDEYHSVVGTISMIGLGASSIP
jgi:hypothetical protein